MKKPALFLAALFLAALFLIPDGAEAFSACEAKERAAWRIEVAEKNLSMVETHGYLPVSLLCNEAGCWEEVRDHPTKLVYDPLSPFAREDGYDEIPAIDALAETNEILLATRSYERAARYCRD